MTAHFKDEHWICKCGNQPHTDGFQPCLKTGKLVEPTEKDWTDGFLYRCMGCDAIIHFQTMAEGGQIVGKTTAEFIDQTEA